MFVRITPFQKVNLFGKYNKVLVEESAHITIFVIREKSWNASVTSKVVVTSFNYRAFMLGEKKCTLHCEGLLVGV